jgi:hypothetical protein
MYIHQNIRTVCHWFGIHSLSFLHKLIALRINWPPEKLMLVVTVQLPTRVNQPVIHEAMGAYSLEASIADL